MAFRKGTSGNPGGYANAHKALAKRFLSDARSAWKTHGRGALDQMAESDPSKFVMAMIALMPKNIQIDSHVEHTHVMDITSAIKELRDIWEKLGYKEAPQIELPHYREIDTVPSEENKMLEGLKTPRVDPDDRA